MRYHYKGNQFAELIGNIEGEVIGGIGSYLGDPALAKELSEYILRDVATNRSTGPNYNNYSGNLNRSYMCRIRFGNRSWTYMTPKNLVPNPKIGTIELEYSVGRTARVYYLTEGRHPVRLKKAVKGRKKEYYKQKRRDNTYYRYYKRGKEAPMGIYQYGIKNGDETAYMAPRPSRTNRMSYQIAVGNYTPYAGYVERQGYRVLRKDTRKWEAYISKICGVRIPITIKNAVYNINTGRYQFKGMYRDEKGRFTSK